MKAVSLSAKNRQFSLADVDRSLRAAALSLTIKRSDAANFGLLLILSMLTTASQIIQTKVFSALISPELVYVVISVALMGFGISGTVLTLFPSLRKLDLQSTLAVLLLLFGISLLLANVVLENSSRVRAIGAGSSWVPPAVLILMFVLPYLFSGMGIALGVLSDRRRVGFNYCATLFGSALGCVSIYAVNAMEDMMLLRVIVLGNGVVCLAVLYERLRGLRSLCISAALLSVIAVSCNRSIRSPVASAGLQSRAVVDSSLDIARLGVELSVVSLLLILMPLVFIRDRAQSLLEAIPLAGYYFSLGVGFMAIELGMMRTFSEFFSHAYYSTSAILFSIMVFSGFGSLSLYYLKIDLNKAINISIFGITVYLAIFHLYSEKLLEEAASLNGPGRFLSTIATLAPLGFFMGMPFPALLQVVERQSARLSAWVFGVNGFACVLASLAFTSGVLLEPPAATLHCAMAAYVGALLSFYLYRVLLLKEKYG